MTDNAITSQDRRHAALYRQAEAERHGTPINSKIPDLVVTDMDPVAVWSRFNGVAPNALRRAIARPGGAE